MTLTQQILSQLPNNPYTGLQRVDALWQALKQGDISVPQVVETSDADLDRVEWDVVVAGGTLGIFIGAALAKRGWRVALVERGKLRGRDQEWNISRQELNVFLSLELLTAEELEQAIATEFNPVRVSFLGGKDIWVRDVLNIGVDPVYLLEVLKTRFLAAGGQLFEQANFDRATVHPNGISVQFGATDLKARLLLDIMGHFSPIARQARGDRKPDGVCIVVGTCAQGYPHNDTGDLLVSFTPLQQQCQYFWEAFPARDGRTTYLFTYLDAHPDRPSLEEFFEEYFRLLPQYQAVELEQLAFQRALFGFFPCYRDSPLAPHWNRIVPVGDSSGNQSPLSFGGFGAMLRHLSRLTDGMHEALQTDSLSQADLSFLQPYQPNLAVTWLFQRSMSAAVDRTLAPDQINQLLVAVFDAMQQAGPRVLNPFLQDVVQFPKLAEALFRTSLLHPGIIAKVIPQVGLPALLDWSRHYTALGAYSVLHPLAQAIAPWLEKQSLVRGSPSQQYRWHQRVQAWKYGSGRDYSE